MFTLSIIRGDAGLDANGVEFNDVDIDWPYEVWEWLSLNGALGDDDRVWVLVTHGDEDPGSLANLIAQWTVEV